LAEYHGILIESSLQKITFVNLQKKFESEEEIMLTKSWFLHLLPLVLKELDGIDNTNFKCSFTYPCSINLLPRPDSLKIILVSGFWVIRWTSGVPAQELEQRRTAVKADRLCPRRIRSLLRPS